MVAHRRERVIGSRRDAILVGAVEDAGWDSFAKSRVMPRPAGAIGRAMRALPLVMLAAACARMPDVDGDGRLTVLAIGDSNTKWLPCAWPEGLRGRHGVAVVNAGVFGLHATTALRDDMLRPRLVDEHPDVVVIALGTNDVATGVRPEVVVETLLLLASQASSHCYGSGRCIASLVATVPPIYSPPNARDFMPQIRAINTTLRTRVDAAHLVDFDSWMPEQFDPELVWRSDGVHLGCKAQALRADAVERLLWWPSLLRSFFASSRRSVS